MPAVRELLVRADAFRRGRGDFAAHTGLYGALRERGEAPDALLFGEKGAPAFVPSSAQLLFKGKNTVSPTMLERYFSCPYKNFAESGLLLSEREEGAVRVLDTGIFMHEVLRLLALKIPGLSGAEECAAFVRAEAERLSLPRPSAICRTPPRAGTRRSRSCGRPSSSAEGL